MKHKHDLRADLCLEYYEVLIAALRYVAHRCGYAIGVHGSLKRDIDLIAAPWRDSAVNGSYLVEEIRKTTEMIIGTARVRYVDQAQPQKNPCGRLSWTLYLTHSDDGPYLDISVMPKGAETQ